MSAAEPGLPVQTPFAGRVLVVGDRVGLRSELARRYPAVRVATVPTYLAAIAELAGEPVHAVLCFVEPSFAPLERAVRGLRRAAGGDMPVVLCCEPAGEPLTRKALEAGASDYLICPPRVEELDRVLRLRGAAVPTDSAAAGPGPADIAAFRELLAGLAAPPQRLARHLAEFVAGALPATSVEVTIEAAVKRVGDTDREPVLREPIVRGEARLGEIALGPARHGAYTAADLERLRAWAGVFAEIVEAVRRRHHWRHLAMTDDLTRLPNRRYLTKFLNDVLARAARERFRVTVCMFDIDDFKHYNDAYGHATGDAIIKAMGQLFLRHCRVEDVVARYGGDEFVVVFWDAELPRVAGSEHPHAAVAVMQRFQETLRTHEFGCLGRGGQGELTVSGGLASYPWHATTAEGLLAAAGQALLEAKRSGKGRMHFIG